MYTVSALGWVRMVADGSVALDNKYTLASGMAFMVGISNGRSDQASGKSIHTMGWTGLAQGTDGISL